MDGWTVLFDPMQAYAAVSLLSAFLLFLVQPLIAKAILPWFGGAPSVWTICLLFFQSALLAGYAYAHLSKRLASRRQVAVHLALLLLTIAALPILPSAAWKPTGNESPAWRILGLLTVTVGAPYFMLATTAPLLQDWFGREASASPYRLYAWSNTGSLVALLGYPFVFERLLSIPQQARVWSVAYVVFVVCCAGLAIRVFRLAPHAPPQAEDPGSGGDRRNRGLWFALAACGSGLLLSITNQLSLDVAAIPFLWVIPLALYLVTFIIAFGGYYRRIIWRPAFIIGLGMMAVLYKLGASASLPLQIGGSTFTLFAGCMICHGELAGLAPRSRDLTAFYLTMSAGGAVGGLLVALVAPVVFSDFWELPLFLLLPYVLMAIVMMREAPGTKRPVTWIAIGAILWLGIAAFLLPALRGPDKRVATARNFYGVLHVLDEPLDSARDSLHALRHLRHGRITHGTQFLDPAARGRTTAYYAEGSGVELAIDHHPRRAAGQHLAIGAIGLGVGTIAAYGMPGDTLRFYEINPDVERLARRYFTFLADSKATVEVELGDGRLALERDVAVGAGVHRYDVLVADAFAGDAIPVHLLTVEAMALYWQALKDDGVLAVHVSNRYLNLTRVISGIAPRFHKRIVRIRRGSGAGALGSTWVLITSNREFLNYVANNVPFGADIPAEPPVVWTDAFSNLYDVLGEEES